MADALTEELLRLNARLLESIATGDWATYQELCAPTLTAFEPEALGHLVEGLDFHHFYFKLGGFSGPNQTTMCDPNVRVLGDVAVIAYIRLNQRVGAEGTPTTTGAAETRVWHKQGGKWRHVHFHRSPIKG